MIIARRVLLVSADGALRDLVHEALRDRNVPVDEMRSEEELMARALRARNDRDVGALIVDLDVSRARIALLEALRVLLPELPIFVVCTFPAVEEHARIVAAGAVVLDVPVDVSALVASITRRRSA